MEIACRRPFCFKCKFKALPVPKKPKFSATGRSLRSLSGTAVANGNSGSHEVTAA